MSQSARTAEPVAAAEPWRHFPAGSSPRMAQVRAMIEQAAGLTANVLITGEFGTGKKWAARNIHALSSRSDRPFVPVNCGAVSPDRLESELFGHEKSAFTGASSARVGRLEAADGGTLFLDEIDQMRMPVQVRLLRVLQEGVFERVGSNKVRTSDLRIIAATPRDLEKAIREGRFAEDLFYRLNVFQIELPALRERLDDLPELVETILRRNAESEESVIKMTPGALRVLRHYEWPGNIRELSNSLERLCVLYPGTTVDISKLPTRYTAKVPLRETDRRELESARASGPQPQDFELPSEGLPLKKYLEKVEVALIRRALHEANGVVAHAAKRLQVGRTTLAEKMKRYGLRASA